MKKAVFKLHKVRFFSFIIRNSELKKIFLIMNYIKAFKDKFYYLVDNDKNKIYLLIKVTIRYNKLLILHV